MVGANGHSWVSSPCGQDIVNGGNLSFQASLVHPTNPTPRSYGLQVRCVQAFTLCMTSIKSGVLQSIVCSRVTL